MAICFGLDGRVVGVRFPVESTIFFPPLGSTQPDIQWVPGVKRQALEADHSSPTSVEVKKMWIYTSTRSYAFMAQCLMS
jgi:hypothetical protein